MLTLHVSFNKRSYSSRFLSDTRNLPLTEQSGDYNIKPRTTLDTPASKFDLRQLRTKLNVA